jgi:hypothetical protein
LRQLEETKEWGNRGGQTDRINFGEARIGETAENKFWER